MAQVPVEDLFECTICLDVPASPIHSCSNGHIICGICAEKITKCGLCQTELHVSVLAERFSRQLDFKTRCPNFDYGCCAKITAADLKDHIPKCYYRNAVCNELTKEVCNDASIPLLNFPSHLQEKHNCHLTILDNQEILKSVRTLTLVNNKLPENGKMPMEIIVNDGKKFLLHSFVRKDVVYFWMTVLGDKEEGLKYMHKLTLVNETTGMGKMKCSWTMPVLPYHDHPNLSTTAVPSPLFVAIPESNFLQLCFKDGVKLKFAMTQQILEKS